jgi:hypothetical protein
VSRGPGALQRRILDLLARPEIAATNARGDGPVGMFQRDVARLLFGDAEPTFSQVQSLRRALRALARSGCLAFYTDGEDRRITRAQRCGRRVWRPCGGPACRACAYGLKAEPLASQPHLLGSEAGLEQARAYGVHRYSPRREHQERTLHYTRWVALRRVGRPPTPAEEAAVAARLAEIAAMLQDLAGAAGQVR